MGITINAAEFLLQCHADGVSFEKTLTLGRQNVFVNPNELDRLFRDYGFSEGFATSNFKDSRMPFADKLIETLGGKSVESIDISDYEGATVLHDLNYPIPDELRGQYDCLIDGGTLEHIFFFPTALKNCMELVKVGGHAIFITPANNWFGHGFYQFSPELYYRALSPENGYQVERVVALEEEVAVRGEGKKARILVQNSQWFTVPDPAELRRRTHLVNSRGVYLFIVAKRVADVPIFQTPPQQSDYAAAWDRAANPVAGGKTAVLSQFEAIRKRLKRIKIKLPKPKAMIFRKQRRKMSWSGDRLSFIPYKRRRPQ